MSSGTLSPTAAWAISIGARADTPSSFAKEDPDCANEDALLVAESGPVTLMVVADAHFGRAPSHTLLRDLRTRLDGDLPRTVAALRDLLDGLAQRPAEPRIRGGTSLMLACYDRDTRRGCGASYFDSTFALLGSAGHRRPLAAPHAGIVYLNEPATLAPERADWFRFEARPGDLLLAYTDGIDCCHYNQPETSVTPEVMASLWSEGSADRPEAFLRGLVQQALDGVGPHPGGEDNIAAIAVRA